MEIEQIYERKFTTGKFSLGHTVQFFGGRVWIFEVIPSEEIQM